MCLAGSYALCGAECQAVCRVVAPYVLAWSCVANHVTSERSESAQARARAHRDASDSHRMERWLASCPSRNAWAREVACRAARSVCGETLASFSAAHGQCSGQAPSAQRGAVAMQKRRSSSCALRLHASSSAINFASQFRDPYIPSVSWHCPGDRERAAQQHGARTAQFWIA